LLEDAGMEDDGLHVVVVVVMGGNVSGIHSGEIN